MDITEITDDMVSKKITCYIDGTFIDDGEITKEGDNFYILQNEQDGFEIKNKKGYKYSWTLKDGSQIKLKSEFINVSQIKLKESLTTSIELWI
jgi:hypothetical protein